MGISRSRGIYPTGYFGPLYGTAAYAKQGGEIFQYVSDGSGPNDVAGATYRTHVFDNVGYNLIYFDKPGYVDVVVIAGGGGGRGSRANNNNTSHYWANGGGGGGGIREYYGYQVNAGAYSVYVGKGGASANGVVADGEYSRFDSVEAAGGGGGGAWGTPGRAGGSGGGGYGHQSYGTGIGGSGLTNQGFDGGASNNSAVGGGGGGAGGTGSDGHSSNLRPDGGPGKFITFYSNQGQYYSGGGAGAVYGGNVGSPLGGIGGGADGRTNATSNGIAAHYYGGGGGGGVAYRNNTNVYVYTGPGYQGLVMIRYRVY